MVSVGNKNHRLQNNFGAKYWPLHDAFFLGGVDVYCKGKWAEIVKEPTPAERLIPVKEADFKRDNLQTREAYIRSQNVTINGEKVAIQELIEGYKQLLRIKDILG